MCMCECIHVNLRVFLCTTQVHECILMCVPVNINARSQVNLKCYFSDVHLVF